MRGHWKKRVAQVVQAKLVFVDESHSNDPNATDAIGDSVAQQANRIGSKIIDRRLQVQPTITIRPGWSRVQEVQEGAHRQTRKRFAERTGLHVRAGL